MKNKLIIAFWIIIVSVALFFSVVALKEENTSLPNLFKKNSLPTVNSYDNFQSIIKRAEYQKNGGLKGVVEDYMYENLGSMQSGMAGSGSAMSGDVRMPFKSASVGIENADGSSDYSKTNIQVEGVDEGDIVKTDGKYIYQLTNNNLFIAKVNPTDKMEVVYKEAYDEYYPLEMYVDDKHLVVIGEKRLDYGYYYGGPFRNASHTTAYVYELKERKNLEKIREVKVDGGYLSSRMIKNDLYIVTNKYTPMYRTFEDRTFVDENKIKPMYYDSFKNEEKIIDWDKIYYVPNSLENNFLIISSFSVSKPNKKVNVEAYLGAGNTIYASQDNLYVTKGNYGNNSFNSRDKETDIYKFKLNNGKIDFSGNGSVKGHLLNQFSMDEHNGYLRIATTNGESWDRYKPSKSYLFVLDKNLKVVGQISDIAPGESIFSMRFMGDRGYMVTFKKVDPLFVIDLKEPKNPNILGQLKIPGYSDYLHPYDENHIIGFGRDAIESPDGDFAYIEGLKMALFDVSDVNNPKEKFVEIIGDRGSDSELFENHKALLFSKEKNIIAFPAQINEESTVNGDLYRNYIFDGALVYGLDLKNGFTLKKRISHYTEDESFRVKSYPDRLKAIRRILYIGENLYTVSDEKIKAHDVKDFKFKGYLKTFTN